MADHAGRAVGEATAAIYRRHPRWLIPSPEPEPVADIGYEESLVQQLLADGYNPERVNVSQGKVTIVRAPRVSCVIRVGCRPVPSVRPGQFAAVTTTGLFGQLNNSEVL